MAAALEDLTSLKAALRSGARCERSVWVAAVKHGRLPVLDWLHATQEPTPELLRGLYLDAARFACVDVLHWLSARGAKPSCPGTALMFAVRSRHAAPVRWLIDVYGPACWTPPTFAPLACAYAAGFGDLPLLAYLRDRGCPWDHLTTESAAAGGHLHVLRWCLEIGLPAADGTCDLAAEYGHIHILQWARMQAPPLPWSPVTCTAAARAGQLAALQWLRSQDPPCSWSSDVVAVSSGGGHTALLEWARANGCPEVLGDDVLAAEG
jgi:hypothetical protein